MANVAVANKIAELAVNEYRQSKINTNRSTYAAQQYKNHLASIVLSIAPSDFADIPEQFNLKENTQANELFEIALLLLEILQGELDSNNEVTKAKLEKLHELLPISSKAIEKANIIAEIKIAVQEKKVDKLKEVDDLLANFQSYLSTIDDYEKRDEGYIKKFFRGRRNKARTDQLNRIKGLESKSLLDTYQEITKIIEEIENEWNFFDSTLLKELKQYQIKMQDAALKEVKAFIEQGSTSPFITDLQKNIEKAQYKPVINSLFKNFISKLDVWVSICNYITGIFEKGNIWDTAQTKLAQSFANAFLPKNQKVKKLVELEEIEKLSLDLVEVLTVKRVAEGDQLFADIVSKIEEKVKDARGNIHQKRIIWEKIVSNAFNKIAQSGLLVQRLDCIDDIFIFHLNSNCHKEVLEVLLEQKKAFFDKLDKAQKDNVCNKEYMDKNYAYLLYGNTKKLHSPDLARLQYVYAKQLWMIQVINIIKENKESNVKELIEFIGAQLSEKDEYFCAKFNAFQLAVNKFVDDGDASIIQVLGKLEETYQTRDESVAKKIAELREVTQKQFWPGIKDYLTTFQTYLNKIINNETLDILELVRALKAVNNNQLDLKNVSECFKQYLTDAQRNNLLTLLGGAIEASKSTHANLAEVLSIIQQLIEGQKVSSELINYYETGFAVNDVLNLRYQLIIENDDHLRNIIAENGKAIIQDGNNPDTFIEAIKESIKLNHAAGDLINQEIQTQVENAIVYARDNLNTIHAEKLIIGLGTEEQKKRFEAIKLVSQAVDEFSKHFVSQTQKIEALDVNQAKLSEWEDLQKAWEAFSYKNALDAKTIAYLRHEKYEAFIESYNTFIEKLFSKSFSFISVKRKNLRVIESGRQQANENLPQWRKIDKKVLNILQQYLTIHANILKNKRNNNAFATRYIEKAKIMFKQCALADKKANKSKQQFAKEIISSFGNQDDQKFLAFFEKINEKTSINLVYKTLDKIAKDIENTNDQASKDLHQKIAEFDQVVIQTNDINGYLKSLLPAFQAIVSTYPLLVEQYIAIIDEAQINNDSTFAANIALLKFSKHLEKHKKLVDELPPNAESGVLEKIISELSPDADFKKEALNAADKDMMNAVTKDYINLLHKLLSKSFEWMKNDALSAYVLAMAVQYLHLYDADKTGYQESFAAVIASAKTMLKENAFNSSSHQYQFAKEIIVNLGSKEDKTYLAFFEKIDEDLPKNAIFKALWELNQNQTMILPKALVEQIVKFDEVILGKTRLHDYINEFFPLIKNAINDLLPEDAEKLVEKYGSIVAQFKNADGLNVGYEILKKQVHAKRVTALLNDQITLLQEGKPVTIATEMCSYFDYINSMEQAELEKFSSLFRDYSNHLLENYKLMRKSVKPDISMDDDSKAKLTQFNKISLEDWQFIFKLGDKLGETTLKDELGRRTMNAIRKTVASTADSNKPYTDAHKTWIKNVSKIISAINEPGQVKERDLYANMSLHTYCLRAAKNASNVPDNLLKQYDLLFSESTTNQKVDIDKVKDLQLQGYKALFEKIEKEIPEIRAITILNNFNKCFSQTFNALLCLKEKDKKLLRKQWYILRDYMIANKVSKMSDIKDQSSLPKNISEAVTEVCTNSLLCIALEAQVQLIQYVRDFHKNEDHAKQETVLNFVKHITAVIAKLHANAEVGLCASIDYIELARQQAYFFGQKLDGQNSEEFNKNIANFSIANLIQKETSTERFVDQIARLVDDHNKKETGELEKGKLDDLDFILKNASKGNIDLLLRNVEDRIQNWRTQAQQQGKAEEPIAQSTSFNFFKNIPSITKKAINLAEEIISPKKTNVTTYEVTVQQDIDIMNLFKKTVETIQAEQQIEQKARTETPNKKTNSPLKKIK